VAAVLEPSALLQGLPRGAEIPTGTGSSCSWARRSAP